jgi:hypothetical protein
MVPDMCRRAAAVLLVLALAGCTHRPQPTGALAPVTTVPAPISHSPGTPSVAPPTPAPAPTSRRSTPKPAPSKAGGSTAATCNGGSLSFGSIGRPYVLTRVTPAFTVKASGYTVPPFTAVATVTAAVLGAPQVPKVTAYRSFAARAGFDPDQRLLGEVYDGSGAPLDTLGLTPGKYVVYESVHEVRATYTYRCGGKGVEPYTGLATSALAESAGIINCAKSLPAGSHDDAKAAKKRCAKR